MQTVSNFKHLSLDVCEDSAGNWMLMAQASYWTKGALFHDEKKTFHKELAEVEAEMTRFTREAIKASEHKSD